MRRILTIEDEEVIGCALTAIFQDAPGPSFQLIDGIDKLKAASPKHVRRIGVLFDRC